MTTVTASGWCIAIPVCNTCEGAGAGLRTFLRLFRGVNKFYLAKYVAIYETMTNARSSTPEVIRSRKLSKEYACSQSTRKLTTHEPSLFLCHQAASENMNRVIIYVTGAVQVEKREECFL